MSNSESKAFGLIQISGPDAEKFLQGQVTCDVSALKAEKSSLGAHCNPQGRVLFLFRIFYEENAYYLVLPQTMAAQAIAALKKYAVFFKKLEFHDKSQETPIHLKQRAAAEWSYFDLIQGIPQVYPETSGLFLPHDLNLHSLQGISWDKGCYTGQEIIARMQYRGKLKNHLYRAQIHTPALPRPGAEVFHSAKENGFQVCGLIVDSQKLGYNLYQVLVLTSEKQHAVPLRLDPQQNETWEWLP